MFGKFIMQHECTNIHGKLLFSFQQMNGTFRTCDGNDWLVNFKTKGDV